jgi:twinkle protein
LNELLKLAAIENQANGIDSVVYDPWNSITHKRVGMVHEFLSEELTKITRFARTQDVLFNIVAHPKIPVVGRDGSIPVPDLYSISDGAMWRNKADYGIICHRPDHNKDMLEVHIQKIKYKWMGKIGIFQFDYDNPSGRFKAPEDKFFLLPHESEPAF